MGLWGLLERIATVNKEVFRLDENRRLTTGSLQQYTQKTQTMHNNERIFAEMDYIYSDETVLPDV